MFLYMALFYRSGFLYSGSSYGPLDGELPPTHYCCIAVGIIKPSWLLDPSSDLLGLYFCFGVFSLPFEVFPLFEELCEPTLRTNIANKLCEQTLRTRFANELCEQRPFRRNPAKELCDFSHSLWDFGFLFCYCFIFCFCSISIPAYT